VGVTLGPPFTLAPVVLRLVGQVRKPARQHPPGQAEELPIGADPDRSLRDGERDKLRVNDQRRPATPRRDRVLVGEDVRCNDKGFQIRHLELPSRGDMVWKPFVLPSRVPADPPTFTSGL
jgi:hypothetical protein